MQATFHICGSHLLNRRQLDHTKLISPLTSLATNIPWPTIGPELEGICGATLLVNMRDIEPRKEDDGFDGAFLSP